MLVISNIIRIFEYKLYIMQRTKFIKTITINDYKYGGNDVQFSVFGIFDTKKIHWEYYAVSYVKTSKVQ